MGGFDCNRTLHAVINYNFILMQEKLTRRMHRKNEESKAREELESGNLDRYDVGQL